MNNIKKEVVIKNISTTVTALTKKSTIHILQDVDEEEYTDDEKEGRNISWSSNKKSSELMVYIL